MNGRIIRIETRRNIALWLLPPVLVLAWLNTRGSRESVLIWAEASVTVRNTVLFIGPFIAGAAAWMAGRERRRGLEELLATTPHPAWSRQLMAWVGTTLWGVLAYVAAGSYIVGLTARHAVWGGPTVWPMVVGLLALPAHAAIGFAIGRSLPSRFTAPLVAVMLFFAQVFIGLNGVGSTTYPPNSRFDWVAFLSPLANLDTSVWYGVRPAVGLPQALFLLGLTGLALGSLVLHDRRGPAAWGITIASGLLIAAGVAAIIRATPYGGTPTLQATRVIGVAGMQAELIPYEPVCSADSLSVCVHPAYRPWLHEYAAAINRIAAPLSGLPGVPVRAEQRPSYTFATIDGVLLFRLEGMQQSPDPQFAGLIPTYSVFQGSVAVP